MHRTKLCIIKSSTHPPQRVYNSHLIHYVQQPSEKQLGTLKFKRAVRINVEEVMAADNNPPTTERDLQQYTQRSQDSNGSDDRYNA